MHTTNRTRQAAFKSRMREAGKQQLTVWVTPAQANQIKALLATEMDAVPPATGAGAASPNSEVLASSVTATRPVAR